MRGRLEAWELPPFFIEFLKAVAVASHQSHRQWMQKS
jgi:hypothetical protein